MRIKDKQKSKDSARFQVAEDSMLSLDAVLQGVDVVADSSPVAAPGEETDGKVEFQAGMVTENALEPFVGFKAALAVPSKTDSPLIFDIVYSGKLFLVAFALAHADNNSIVLSTLNAPLWGPLKELSGAKVLQPMFGSTIEQVEAGLASMRHYDSGTHFLVTCNDIAVIASVVKRLNAMMSESTKLH